LVAGSIWHRPLIAEVEKENLAKRQANAAIALLLLGRKLELWPLLRQSKDSRLRSYLIHRLAPLGANPEDLIRRIHKEPDVSALRALFLSLGEFEESQIPAQIRQSLRPEFMTRFKKDPDPGLHSAIGWLLRQWGFEKELEQAEKALATGRFEDGRQWFINTQGQTMALIPKPGTFMMGSPGYEAGRDSRVAPWHRKRIDRSFAIGSTEVTIEQFLVFRPNHPFDPGFYPVDSGGHLKANCPVNVISWYDAAAYCNWLSKKEGIDPMQWCYPPESQIRDEMKPYSDYLSRTGYRLPTEAEWEYACRANSSTSRFYGESDELLPFYARGRMPSRDKAWPVGGLKPNDFGLFDMLGNIVEWCQDASFGQPYVMGPPGFPAEDKEDTAKVKDNVPRALRGGPAGDPSDLVRSNLRDRAQPKFGSIATGFRVARTIR
jgi:formylglycine-generating enzyme required for sulfatase activity